jgi:hypothetical protein
MTGEKDTSWTLLSPTLEEKKRSRRLAAEVSAHARELARVPRDEAYEEGIDELRSAFVERVKLSGWPERQAVLSAGLILTDLAIQGWQLRVQRGRVQVRPPAQLSEDRAAEKARIRRQELVKRDAQLRHLPAQKFIQAMERSRVFNGKFVSIFSLMRDGRELAEGLRRARACEGETRGRAVANVVDPYLQFVTSEDAVCPFTGLRLMDVWRYFRHTWSNQYTSVPGRTMAFVVRDRAAACHPVIGIGALSSPVMQIRERDAWIGWHPDTFLESVRERPTLEVARWLVEIVDRAIEEIYVDDLVEDGVLTKRDLGAPKECLIAKLLAISEAERKAHHRYVRARDHKKPRPAQPRPEYWVQQARTHLFKSKRTLALATYLQLREALKAAFGRSPTEAKLAELASTGAGCDVIRKVLKKAKADRVGIAVADLTVCGAVQPYNAVLGGKLVAMLAASPETVLEYRKRYSGAESEIASSIAGRAIVRPPALVLIGTTSLYGVGSSQYNRIKVPCDRLQGAAGEVIRYDDLGHSEAFGTSQFSDETVETLVDLVQQSDKGQRVNSIFGEGVSPKLRKIRQGLDLLNLPSTLLLRHHRRRIVYAVRLIKNLREHLLGMARDPEYVFPLDDGPAATARIGAWWRERWLSGRISSDEVLADVQQHTLVRPIRHGARVVIPPPPKQKLLFADLS